MSRLATQGLISTLTRILTGKKVKTKVIKDKFKLAIGAVLATVISFNAQASTLDEIEDRPDGRPGTSFTNQEDRKKSAPDLSL